ncbi:MAG: methionine--tRNA ligase subunit beta, partial [Thermoplasmatota archaeon]
NARNFTENWLKEGLKDRPITRDLLYGVPIPLSGYDDKRIYVWFEAVVGYLSASIEWSKTHRDPDAWKRFWLSPDSESRHYYFMGKDNIPFHTIIWPAMLMGYSDGKGVRYHLPYDVPANEFMNFQGSKLSKSRGNLVEVSEVVPRFDADAVRYYLTSNMPETRDSNWAWDEFAARVNDELVGTYGNLVNRVLTFTKKHFETVPEVGALSAASEELIQKIANTHAEVTRALEAVELRRGLKEVMALAQAGNQYVDARAPWKLAKSDPLAFAECQHVSLRLVRSLAILSAPFLPNASEAAWKQLGETHPLAKVGWGAALEDIRAGQKLGDVAPLFAKLDPKEVVPMATPVKADAEAAKSAETTPTKPTVTYDEFAKMDLRVGVVRSIEPHPKADKLYVLKVDLGAETRQILAGLREHVKPEELLGKHVVVIANLAPREIRGLKSEGMLLAAEGGGVVAPLAPTKDVPPGSGIK